ncbi:hypothetical protein SASC598P14_005690 [Snodgrassella alvi SCGC AB-598-P14]|nr:hypothetical protein SASC598P14_005690 [Snodgrassella alvi SCGC AB-598-P14]
MSYYITKCKYNDKRIFIFFTGHCHTLAGYHREVGYLIPVDADLNDFSTLICWDHLTRNSAQIRAKHILFIMGML